MKLLDKEYMEVIKQFEMEKDYKYKRLDKEDKELWRKIGRVYQDGNLNEIFQAYLKGYAFGKHVTDESYR